MSIHPVRPPLLTAEVRQQNCKQAEKTHTAKKKRRGGNIRNQERKKKEERGEECSS